MDVTSITDLGSSYKATIDGKVCFVPKDSDNELSKAVSEAILSGVTVEALPDPEPVVPKEVTKLQIFDEIAQMEEDDPATYSGLWSSVESFIEADATRLKRWNLAIGISSQDNLLEDLRLALNWTQEEKEQFLIAAGSRL